MVSIEWPWQYEFPPFFTLQPNLETRKKQLEAWKILILTFYKSNKKFVVNLADEENSELFKNNKINRKLSVTDIRTIFDVLETSGNVEWIDKQKTKCFIFWKSLDDWAKLIYNWVSANGMTGSVCTLFELAHGDETVNEEFHELDDQVLVKALQVLERQNKAELMSYDGNDGVKFF